MTANIIHNIAETERYKLLCEQIDKQKIEAILWTAMLGYDAKTNISKAHKQIVRWAKEKGKKEVLIMEDDILFPAEDGFQYFLNKKPKEYDVYLGGIYLNNQKLKEDGKIKFIFSALHCYIVHEKFYDTFLEIDEVQSLDNSLSKLAILGLADIKCCYPMAAVQQELPSSNIKGAIYRHSDFFTTNNVYGFEK